MKKKFYLILSVLIAGVSTLLFGACGSYAPTANEHYFKVGEVYRVFTADGAEPKHVENYAIHSFTIPMIGSTSARAEISDGFTENSLFFGDPDLLNKDGVIAVYDYLDISGYELTDEYYACYTTGLFSYNKKIKYATTTSVTLDLTDKPNRTVIGEVADVDIYTFNYEDRSVSDGSVVKSGSFEIILSGKSYVDTFVAYQ